jgi:hypothetical protein
MEHDLNSVADAGCLSRFPDPKSTVKKIPNPGSGSASKNLSIFFYPKNFSRLTEI